MTHNRLAPQSPELYTTQIFQQAKKSGFIGYQSYSSVTDQYSTFDWLHDSLTSHANDQPVSWLSGSLESVGWELMVMISP